jgi:dGTPase
MVTRPASPVLAAYASDPLNSRGRRHAEPASHEHEHRSDFQRDRDRIVHSSAFRRLVYKTQVFLNHEGDLFRTRLTHSLEVAQLARSMSRHLGLHEDLVEAISLAHDLGHTPFGHAGQDALNECMRPHGGFEHNHQSLRVVDVLEHRYPQFDGLNLCFETREGILKHCSAQKARLIEAQEPGGVAARFLIQGSPSLEAQLANLADQIAYNAHDIDDGVRSGLLTLEQMSEQPLFGQHLHDSKRAHPHLGAEQSRRLLYDAVRRMLSDMVYDACAQTRDLIFLAGVSDPQQVRNHAPLVRFSDVMHAQCVALKRFLFANLYRHPQVLDKTLLAQQVVRELFDIYMTDSTQMTGQQKTDVISVQAQKVADYIAGMTDRFAIREHRRLTGHVLFDPLI